MKAEEIRKLRDENLSGRVDGSLPDDQQQMFFLAEIAAQLAELNDNIGALTDAVAVDRGPSLTLAKPAVET